MPKPLTINYDTEYNLNKESDVSPFMQALWEGREAALEGRKYNTCPYKDMHFSKKWAEGFGYEMQELHEAVYSLRMMTARLGKKGKNR